MYIKEKNHHSRFLWRKKMATKKENKYKPLRRYLRENVPWTCMQIRVGLWRVVDVVLENDERFRANIVIVPALESKLTNENINPNRYMVIMYMPVIIYRFYLENFLSFLKKKIYRFASDFTSFHKYYFSHFFFVYYYHLILY